MKKTIITVLLLCFFCGYSYAQLGGGGPYSRNLIIKDSDSVVDGNGTILDFGSNLSVSYSSGEYNVTASGGGGGGCFELDGNSDLMPVANTCVDTLWEEDGNGDLQPQA